MPTLKIEFDDDDTTPDRIAAIARDNGISSEQLVQRAIAQYLGEFGLKPLSEGSKPQSLQALFEETGVLKPK